MRRRALFMVAALALLAVVGGTSVYAQDIAVVNVPFKFTFNQRQMDAGKYEVTVSSDGIVTMTPTKGTGALGPALTRLGQHETAINVPTFIFDKIGEKYILSELWLPMQDGFLLNDLKQPHQHHVIKGAKKG